jgi:hypothetical protein
MINVPASAGDDYRALGALRWLPAPPLRPDRLHLIRATFFLINATIDRCYIYLTLNQTPEQRAKDSIDRLLAASGWIVQYKQGFDIRAGLGVAAKEYSTDVGPADYVLFSAERLVGIVKATREDEGQTLSVHEE